MNIRRGLFRLWLVGSLLWIAIIGMIGAALLGAFKPSDRSAGVVIEELDHLIPGKGEFDHLIPGKGGAPPEVQRAIQERLAQERRAALREKLTVYGLFALFAALPPAVVLGLGLALLWAVSGFKKA